MDRFEFAHDRSAIDPRFGIEPATLERLAHELRGWPMIQPLPKGELFRWGHPDGLWLSDGDVTITESWVEVTNYPTYVVNYYDRGSVNDGWQPIKFRQIWFAPEIEAPEITELLQDSHGLRQSLDG